VNYRTVTVAGIPLRGRMGLLVQRGQMLLLPVVGILAGMAIAGVCLELCGVPVLNALRVNELLVQPASGLPSKIVITGASPQASAPPTASAATAPTQVDPPRPSPTTALVPAAVYTWPPNGGGGRDGGGGGRGRRGG
jgi:hypothetical protein